MIEQKNVPFAGKPIKMAYMWRDIERRAHLRLRAQAPCAADVGVDRSDERTAQRYCWAFGF
jgi:hypothetical protein